MQTVHQLQQVHQALPLLLSRLMNNLKGLQYEALFLKYTVDENTDQVHPYPGSPYFHLLKKGEEGQRDNLFIFMAQELSATGNTASEENFSETQLDWLEDLLVRYAGKNIKPYEDYHCLF